MFSKLRAFIFGAALISGTFIANAAGHSIWTVNSDESIVYFGSIKKDKVGEVHSFSGISGTVGAGGKITIAIDLATVETNIPIRNKRILRHVLDAGVPAIFNASIDMTALNSIAIGATGSIAVEGSLTLGAVEIPVKSNFFVIHMSDSKVIVTTESMIMLSTANAGITAGIDKLMELAKLPSISRVSPVTVRLVLEK